MKKQVGVIKTVEVEVDESKFTDEFMEEFRKYFYDFDDIDDHIEYIANLAVNGAFDSFKPFIEGYGEPHEMGIKANIVDTYTDIECDLDDEEKIVISADSDQMNPVLLDKPMRE